MNIELMYFNLLKKNLRLNLHVNQIHEFMKRKAKYNIHIIHELEITKHLKFLKKRYENFQKWAS